MSARVRDVMARCVVAVRTNASFREIVATLRSRRVSALPVLDDGGKVIGVVPEADLISRPDEDIRREITGKIILKEFLTDPASFTVTVKDGIVTLEGSPETATAGHGIVSAVRHIEGVVAVRDRLASPATELIPMRGDNWG
jgi:CBS-domain-containing membrane protein